MMAGVTSPTRRRLSGWLMSATLVAAVTGVIQLLEGDAAASGTAVLYVFAVLPVAVVRGAWFGVLVSVASVAIFHYLFIPPRYSFSPADWRDWLWLAAFVTTSVVVSRLTTRVKEATRLAAEQAAARRVATLVARTIAPAEVFETVTREVGLLSGADLARMERYETDGTVTGVAGWSRSEGDRLAVGTRIGLEGVSIAALVRQSRGPVRVDSFELASGPIADEARALGIRSSVGCPIIVGGRVWGVVAASTKRDEPFPRDTESKIAEFTELVATAVANAESRAELAASRARVVAAGDETRRQLERDLHDGAQQRLVLTVITLKLARQAMGDRTGLDVDLVGEALEYAERATEELRDLAHGILPGALSRGGLQAGVEALVSRVRLPVSSEVTSERLPPALEATAYFIVAEALTNTVKHAGASSAHVAAVVDDGTLRVEVRDDGVGGAQLAGSSGLLGLYDRAAALDGELKVQSPPGGGTVITAALPISPSR
jgi:signal transduction histidine kinase